MATGIPPHSGSWLDDANADCLAVPYLARESLSDGAELERRRERLAGDERAVRLDRRGHVGRRIDGQLDPVRHVQVRLATRLLHDAYHVPGQAFGGQLGGDVCVEHDDALAAG